MEMIKYRVPDKWISYDWNVVAQDLLDARVAVTTLRNIPYQRSWVEILQKMELKREVAGTSRIEGADFTELELDKAITGEQEELRTRSQRQVRAAVHAYEWISDVEPNRNVDGDLIRAIHEKIVKDCDDDHCTPGGLRRNGEKVIFGSPKHRGAEGGQECERAFATLVEKMNSDFKDHDPLIQALAAHYHLAAMHPFLDGNGRTARALEALMLQRAGLKDTCFIAMSNYYYDEKSEYLAALSDVRAKDYDLTRFLEFGLRGITNQTQRLMDEIKAQTQKLLFRDTMRYLTDRLISPRRRAVTERQFKILELMLDHNRIDLYELRDQLKGNYEVLSHPLKALIRDLNYLITLRALTWRKIEDEAGRQSAEFKIDLEWPAKITETEFYLTIKEFPKAKSSFTFSGF